jgi:hypothetical protein
MSGELEAAGALATAGAVAGAIEGREPGKPGEGGCLNCGAALAGPFCSQCGQHAHPHRKLTHVLEEFLHGLVHFDTKAWRTLPMVAFRPGTLTRNYVYGKRARYISPIALFLFTIFLMFFVFAFLPEAQVGQTTNTGGGDASTLEEVREDLTEAREDLAEAEAGLAAGREEMPAAAQAAVEGSIQLLRDEVTRLEARLAEAEAGEAPDAGASHEALPEEAALAESVTASPAESGTAIVAPVDERRRTTWQEVARESAQSDDFVVVRGWDRLNEKFREKLENPEYALYKIQQTAYKFSFLLAPLSLPFIALLFLWKRGVTLYDHMAYALYALSFASLLFVAIVLTALSSWTSWLTGWLMLAALPVHTYFHLKGAYALGWFSALWRTFFMLTFAVIILGIFLVLIIVLGLTG